MGEGKVKGTFTKEKLGQLNGTAKYHIQPNIIFLPDGIILSPFLSPLFYFRDPSICFLVEHVRPKKFKGLLRLHLHTSDPNRISGRERIPFFLRDRNVLYRAHYLSNMVIRVVRRGLSFHFPQTEIRIRWPTPF